MAMVLGHLGPPRCPKSGCMAVGNHQGAQPSVWKIRRAPSAIAFCAMRVSGKACARYGMVETM
eukprot:5536078-Prorocentrum_lima.AAC.1